MHQASCPDTCQREPQSAGFSKLDVSHTVRCPAPSLAMQSTDCRDDTSNGALNVIPVLADLSSKENATLEQEHFLNAVLPQLCVSCD